MDIDEQDVGRLVVVRVEHKYTPAYLPYSGRWKGVH